MGRLERQATHKSREARVNTLRQNEKVLRKEYSKSIHWIILDKPEQVGYERFFVVRDDVLRSSQAAIFTELLKYVNHTTYSRDKSFTHIKPVKGSKFRRHYRNRPKTKTNTIQVLKSLSQRDYNKVPEHLKKYFFKSYSHSKRFGITHRWIIDKQWRFALKIQPYMVTHYRISDEVIWRQIEAIDDELYDRNGPLYAYLGYDNRGWYDDEKVKHARALSIRVIREGKEELHHVEV